MTFQGAKPGQIKSAQPAESLTQKSLCSKKKKVLTDNDLHLWELFAAIQKVVAVSALMDESAARNSLQAVKSLWPTKFIYSWLWEGAGESKVAALQNTECRKVSDYFPNIDFKWDNSGRANITTLLLFLADQPLPCFFFGKCVFKFQHK